jgi:hypothetical protein
MAEKLDLAKPESLLASKASQEAVKSPDYLSVYANNVHLAASVFDFALTFGEMTEESKNGRTIINQKVRVILSKEMTKVLLALLQTNIQGYEEQFGEIVLPRPADAAKKQGGGKSVIAQGVARHKSK